MADYIYLLETRLSPAQQRAIGTVRAIARENDLTVFLTGGAVRDLTSGASVRDLDLTIQGSVLPLRGALEAAGAVVMGEHTAAQRLFLTLPGSVRVEVASAMRVTFPQASRPDYQHSNISDDLRSRDFTANAMAISLNEGSYGLLMDPLNGVADIENRELRLVSNYGFIEDSSRLIRATRLMSRLGWHLEERTRHRYETAKDENHISSLTPWNRGYELEELFQEDDPLRILRALEAEGWSAQLFPGLQSSKANAPGLSELAEKQGQLQAQGIVAQSAVLAFPLVTAKLSASEIANLKHLLVRPGLVADIDAMDGRVRDFAARLSGKEAATPSSAWRLLHETEPNLVLATFATSKAGAVQARIKTFLNESPAARQRIPYALLQEMRITPDLPEYNDLLNKLFFELMDGKLATAEEMKAYLEPYSPPAPPPPVNLRRAKAKKEARPSRSKAKKATEPDVFPETVAEEEEAVGIATGLMGEGDLTGPDHGPEPTPDVPLAEKVAPTPVEMVSEPALEGPDSGPVQRPAEDVDKEPRPGKKRAGKKAASIKDAVLGEDSSAVPGRAQMVPAAPAKAKEQRAKAEGASGLAPKKPGDGKTAKTSVNQPVPGKKGVAPAKKSAVAGNKAASQKAPTKTAPAKKAAAPPQAASSKQTSSTRPAAKKSSAAAVAAIKKSAAKASGQFSQNGPAAKKSPASAKSVPPKQKKAAPAKKSTAAKKAPAKSGAKKTAGRKR